MSLDERVRELIKKIDELHSLVSKTKWSELNREGFVFELERSIKWLNIAYDGFVSIDKEAKLLLEKNTPDISDFILRFRKELIILESNLTMEKHKNFRVELVNATEERDVPDLYSSLQTKILEIILQSRYSIDKLDKFLMAQKIPFVKKGSTARELITLLQQKEDELAELRKKNIDLKRKNFFGPAKEKSVAEMEEELNAKDKALEIAVRESKKNLATHLAQINYVEGSFNVLKEKVRLIEELHENYNKKSIELIRELKKERDYAKTMALEIEQDTLQIRNEHARQIVEMEEKKANIQEKLQAKYSEEINNLKKQLADKSNATEKMNKLIEKQEEEIKRLKGK